MVGICLFIESWKRNAFVEHVAIPTSSNTVRVLSPAPTPHWTTHMHACIESGDSGDEKD